MRYLGPNQLTQQPPWAYFEILGAVVRPVDEEVRRFNLGGHLWISEGRLGLKSRVREGRHPGGIPPTNHNPCKVGFSEGILSTPPEASRHIPSSNNPEYS